MRVTEKPDELALKRKRKLEAAPFPIIPERFYSRREVEEILYCCEAIPDDAKREIAEALDFGDTPSAV